MKNQKNNFKVGFIFLVTVLITACSKTDDTTTPNADARDSFVGSWTNAENSKLFGSTSYTLTISKSSSDNENIIIKNFYNLGAGTSTIVKVSGANLTLSQQQVSAQNLSGSGSLSGGKIHWTYFANDGGAHKDTCTAISSK